MVLNKHSYDTKILVRALGQEAMEKIHEQYIAARFIQRNQVPLTPQQIKMAEKAKQMWKEGYLIGEIAKKLGLTHYRLQRLIYRYSMDSWK